jgi:hypothetical protein
LCPWQHARAVFLLVGYIGKHGEVVNRRNFLRNSLFTAAGVGTFGYGFWSLIPEGPYHLSLSSVRQTISQVKAKQLISRSNWSPFMIFSHLAQSVELSMTGYPQHKSDWFKSNIGRRVFEMFAAKKQMKHGLDEPIPGALLIGNDGDHYQGIQRLELALDYFEQYEGLMQPHFAYGPLSKAEYEVAHALHFYNHLTEIEFS